MDHFTSISVFVRVAEEGSFSAAARSLKMTQPTVSKAIAELERKLGARLLNRTTRTLSLTEVGTTYYQRTKKLLRQLDDADREVVMGKAAIHGRLRVNTSALLAVKLVVPALMAFREAYPAVNVEIIVDDKRIDPVENAMDVAVRLGSLSNSSLRVRRAGTAQVAAYVARSYLELLGLQATEITSFAGHQLIRYTDQKRASEIGDAEAKADFSVSNAVLARELMIAGAGIAVIPTFLVADDVALGKAIRVLANLDMPPAEVNLLHPFSQDAPGSVSAFLDFAVGMWRRAELVQP